MTVHVKLFAILREKAGIAHTTLDLPKASTIAQAIATITLQFPALQNYMARIAFAINRDYAPIDATLHDGDELALIPPVSGG